MMTKSCIAVGATACLIMVSLPRLLCAADSPTTAPATQASTVDQAIALLASGDQSSAEKKVRDSLAQAIRNKTEPDVEEVFLMAVLTRSRFAVQEATPLFEYVTKHAEGTPHGDAARCIAHIDERPEFGGTNLVELESISKSHPDDPLLLWMIGVASRTLKQPDQGVPAYAKLCKMWDPGPVLVHQTYANLLDDMGKSDEALPHRKLAVKLEPSAWAYDGLGNTLTALKKWKDADDAYTHSTDLAPEDPHNWQNWFNSMRQRNDTEGAAKIAARAKEAAKAAEAAQ